MVSIKEFFELREAGYSVDQIREYSSFIESPEQKPDPKPESAPEPKPEQKPDPKPEPAPTEDQLKDVKDTLSMLIGTIRGMNINQMGMPEGQERGAQEILAEIINPPGKGDQK